MGLVEPGAGGAPGDGSSGASTSGRSSYGSSRCGSSPCGDTTASQGVSVSPAKRRSASAVSVTKTSSSDGLIGRTAALPKGDSALSVTRDGKQWINVTELARKIGQAYVADAETGTWSFAEIPAIRSGQLRSAIAPDFELKDRSGKVVRLSDFRGKKVLLKTWASW